MVRLYFVARLDSSSSEREDREREGEGLRTAVECLGLMPTIEYPSLARIVARSCALASDSVNLATLCYCREMNVASVELSVDVLQ